MAYSPAEHAESSRRASLTSEQAEAGIRDEALARSAPMLRKRRPKTAERCRAHCPRGSGTRVIASSALGGYAVLVKDYHSTHRAGPGVE